MLKELRKLQNSSVAKIKDRGKQRASRYAERLGFLPSARLESDAEFLRRFRSFDVYSPDQVLDHYRRRPINFYASFADRQRTVDALREKLASVTRTVAAAEKVCDGRFDLLSFSDLKFGAEIPDWHFEPISGKRSPTSHWSTIDELSPLETGDKKVIWELNRHQYFSTLGQAYWLTDDEKYAETFVRHIESWMDSNPPKQGVNWLSSLEIALRSISWIWAFHFFSDSPHFTSSLLLRMLKLLRLNGRHIERYLSTHFSPNTHLTGEALGLYFLGSFLVELPEAEAWKQLGYRTLLDALNFQVRPDGTYCEQASHYLRYTIDFYCNLLILRRREGSVSEPSIETKLEQLFDCLLHIIQPNGESPNFGDDDGGRLYFLDYRPVTDLRPTLALGAALLRRGDLKFVAENPSAELLWLLGPDGLADFDRLPRAEPKKRSRAFVDGGLFAARSDWTPSATSLLIQCGPHGFLNGGHAHSDALSFVLSIDGEPVFIDSGTYNYTSEPAERDHFRSSTAHNCLTVDHRSASATDGPFSWASTADATLLEWNDSGDRIIFRGRHDGYERLGVRYARTMTFDQKELDIRDEIESSVPNLYEVNFILSPGLSAAIDEVESRVEVFSGARRKILTLGSAVSGDEISGAKWNVSDAWVSPIYGTKVRSQRLAFAVKARGSLNILTKIRFQIDKNVGFERGS